ncbi:YhjD/YihY/BrkB family envelope integrity protein [Acidobacteriota bacterium]
MTDSKSERVSMIPRRISSFLRHSIWTIRCAVSEFFRDFCHQRAASLSYTTFLALVPLVAIFIFVLNLAGFLTEYRDKAQEQVIEHFAPESREAVVNFLNQVIEKLSDYSTSTGLLGFVTFVAVGILVMFSIEGVFNEIWEVRTARSFMKRIFAFWFVLCFIPIALASSAYIKARVERAALVQNIVGGSSFLDFVYGWLVPLCITYLIFFVLYVYMPNTRVAYLYGLCGALLAGTFWEIAKWGFKLYLEKTVSYYQLFGSVGAVPVFFVWVYLSWLIVLFGAEVSYVLQNRNFIEIIRASKIRPVPIHPDYLAALIMGDIAAKFVHGQTPPSSSDLAIRFSVPPKEIMNILDALHEADLVHRINESDRFVLSRPPASIKLNEVFRAIGVKEGIMLERMRDEMGDAVGVLEKARKEVRESVKDITLSTLITQRKKG